MYFGLVMVFIFVNRKIKKIKAILNNQTEQTECPPLTIEVKNFLIFEIIFTREVDIRKIKLQVIRGYQPSSNYVDTQKDIVNMGSTNKVSKVTL